MITVPSFNINTESKNSLRSRQTVNKLNQKDICQLKYLNVLSASVIIFQNLVYMKDNASTSDYCKQVVLVLVSCLISPPSLCLLSACETFFALMDTWTHSVNIWWREESPDKQQTLTFSPPAQIATNHKVWSERYPVFSSTLLCSSAALWREGKRPTQAALFAHLVKSRGQEESWALTRRKMRLGLVFHTFTLNMGEVNSRRAAKLY